MKNKNFTIETKVQYLKEFMFGKEELVIATIVAKNGYKILLDNGDEFNNVSNLSMYLTPIK